MLTYETCKNVAIKKAESFNNSISKAYILNGNYVFDSDVECMGVLPVVVSRKTGETIGLWKYLYNNNLCMDDMKEIDLEKGA